MKFGHWSVGAWVACIVAAAALCLGATEVPLARDAAAVQNMLERVGQGRSVYAANLAKGDHGILFSGRTAELPAGRYRLHAVAAAAPLGNLIVGPVQLHLEVGNAARSCSTIHFPRDDEFVDLTLDFVSPGPALDVLLTWSVTEDNKTRGLLGQRSLAILRADDAGAAGPTPIGMLDAELMDGAGLMELEDEHSTFTMDEATEIPYRMMLAAIFVEPLSPVEVSVRTSQIAYRPGERGHATVTLRNHSRHPVQVTPDVELHWGLNQAIPLDCASVAVPAGGTAAATVDFVTDDLYWGAEIVARVPLPGLPTGEGRQIFAVRNNIWETAITAAHPGHTALFDDMEVARAAARQLRENGFTGFEAFFWGPCDMLDFTPDTERWASGQTAYPGSITGTRNLIEACHDEGIFATVYANLWGGSGPPAMEIQRRHPEWFGNTTFRTYVLDDWDLLGPWQDMRDARLRAPGVAEWCFNQVHVDPLPGLFDLHADELIGTHTMFGWDGVRYDSYYSRAWSVKATRQIRARVEEQVPTFQFGYNSFALRDQRALALDAMVGNGGMVMAEGIRIERGRHLGRFAAEMLSWRDVIWPYGGHGPGMLFRNSTDDETMTPVGIEYQASMILAAGGHLYYTPPNSEMAHYPRFALRYSEYIYNNRMRPLLHPEQVIAFEDDTAFLEWKRFARTLDLDGENRRLVLHLINPPVEQDPFTDKSLKTPVPQRHVPVRINLTPDATVTGAWELRAAPDAGHRPLTHEMRDGTVHLTIPEVRFWTCLVLEYTSATPLPQPITARDKTDTFLQDWHVLGPFPGDAELSTFDLPRPPEEGVDLSAASQGRDGRQIAWQRNLPHGGDKLGNRRLDVRDLLDTRNAPGIAYAYTTVQAATDQDVFLFAGYDDVIAIWVNGAELYRSTKPTELVVDAVKVKAALREGTNEILVKIGHRWLDWSLALRIADEQGAPIADGLTF